MTNSSVAVQDGYFTQALNFGDSAFSGDARWLEITINSCNGGGSSATLSPRVALQAAPYALYALNGPWGSDYWGLSGNNGTTPDTHFVGTTDNMTLTLKVNNNTALRLIPGGAGGVAPNIIGGGAGNTITPAIKGSVIGGGAVNRITANFSVVGGGQGNDVTDHHATVGGGYKNQATADSATVGGGAENQATASFATVGGGAENQATVNFTTIAGGRGNVITGTSGTAAIGGGRGNVITGTAGSAAIGGGRGNVITGTANYANISGGYQNEVSGLAATVGGGNNNDATAANATVPGGYQAQASHYGEMAYAGGQFADKGDAQTSLYVLRNTTTNSTTTELFLDGSGELLTIADDRVVTFDILVVAAQTDGGNSAGYRITGVIENISGAISFVDTPVITELGEDDGSWGVNVDASSAATALKVVVTGSTTNQVRWVATVRTVEVGF